MPDNTPAFLLPERNDRLTLGGGGHLLYSPAFPGIPDTPGFWEGVWAGEEHLPCLLGVLLVDEQGMPMPLKRAWRSWQTHKVVLLYTVEGVPGLEVQEERTLAPGDVCASRFRFVWRGVQPRVLHLVLWSIRQPSEENCQPPCAMQRDLASWRMLPHPLCAALGADRLPESRLCLNTGENMPPLLWEASPFPDFFQREALQRIPNAESSSADAWQMHIALHYALYLEPEGTETICVGAAVSPWQEEAEQNLRTCLAADPLSVSSEYWQKALQGAPQIQCSQTMVELSARHSLAQMHLQLPCINKTFLPEVVRETCWIDGCERASAALMNELQSMVLPDEAGFRYVDYGSAALRLFQLSAHNNWVEPAYDCLSRYAAILQQRRDPDQSGLYLAASPWECTEYCPVRWPGHPFAALDASCTAYSLAQALEQMARALGKPAEASKWNLQGDRICNAVRMRLWNDSDLFFHDLCPQTGKLLPARTIAGFLPYYCGIATLAHLAGLWQLWDERTFGSSYPVPVLSMDHPLFSAEGLWQGGIEALPGCGRILPVSASAALDGLARASRTLDELLQGRAVLLLQRWLLLPFAVSNANRPCKSAHYHPHTGRPAQDTGPQKYPSGWFADMVIRHIAGVQPEPGPEGELRIDPLPFDLDWFRVTGIGVRGHKVDVVWDRHAGYGIYIDGEQRALVSRRIRMEIAM